jgi:hypothetical protein
MKKVIIVTGSPLVGKTHYVKKFLSDTSEYFVLDYPSTLFHKENSFNLIDDLDKQCEIYQEITDSLHDEVQFGDKVLVIECSYGRGSDELYSIVNTFKEIDFDVDLRLVQALPEERPILEAKSILSHSYCSSMVAEEYNMEILNEFIECIKIDFVANEYI